MTTPDIERPPFWLRGGHSQTIVPSVWAQKYLPTAEGQVRERWRTPDDDFIDVDRINATSDGRPLIVLFHGLEGSSSSHYAKAFSAFAVQRELSFAVPHFRGCSGELNLKPRAYHSGDHVEIDWILKRLKAESPRRHLLVVGVSLGGNALMRWAAEHGHLARNVATAIAAVSAPLDLRAAGEAIGAGLNRQIYTRMFLRTMKPKALKKLQQHPGLFDKGKMLSANSLYEFDNAFTAPVHGFANTEDYWQRASAKPLLNEIRVPALLVNAKNDPFIPENSLPTERDVSRSFVTLCQPQNGGHVGFPSWCPSLPWCVSISAMPTSVGAWLLAHA